MAGSPRDLPVARKDGAPLEYPILGDLIPKMLQLQRGHRDEERVAIPGTLMRGSLAATCARAMGYAFLGVPQSDPPTDASLFRMFSGTLMHLAMGEAIAQVWPTLPVQPEAVWHSAEHRASGRTDFLFPMGIPIMEEHGMAGSVAVELKSIGSWQFKKITGQVRKDEDPEGPKWKAIVQGALGGYFLGTDWLLFPYLGLETTSPAEALRHGLLDHNRYSGEWVMSREEFEPIALAELERVRLVYKYHDQGKLPPRVLSDPLIPRRNRVTDPSKGTWVELDRDGHLAQQGESWVCGYCWHQAQCVKDGADAEVPS